MKNMKKKDLLIWRGEDVYFGTHLIGTLKCSVGPWGESTGYFRWCKTVTPINEVADCLGYELYNAHTLEPIPDCI